MAARSAAVDLGHAIGRRARGAADVRWLTTGTVTAVAGNQLTVTIDGASVQEVGKLAGYTTPTQGDVALIAIVRGTKSVQYVAVDKILS